MTSYRQHCPVSAAAEVLGQSWTILVVRELLHGNSRVSEIARGVPDMSSALLARRLKQLAEAGVVTRLTSTGEGRFALTQAGRDLAPVIEHLGHWGRRWTPPPRSGDLKPNLLLLDICRGIDPARLPREKVSLHLRFAEAPPPRWWWLVLSPEGASSTDTDPRLPAVARIDCTVSALAGVWLGHRTWQEILAERTIRFDGTREAVRNTIGWLGRSRFTGSAPMVSASNRMTEQQFD
ncbi:helix-turn-helix domain-containing protein [Amycolatopsis sp. NPDC051371]|uniref:winged helix-turn-helix transcriptional regulator n=1 Tax=Amycolatopsis sp. NPDC051371 TaxID=3155800 RepID=UPI00343789E8